MTPTPDEIEALIAHWQHQYETLAMNIRTPSYVLAVTSRTAAALRALLAENARLREALTQIATGRDAAGLVSDFPREIAQEAIR